MTDPVSEIKTAVSDAETVAKNAALAEVNKQKGWLKTNAKAIIIGLAIGAAAVLAVHFL